MDTTEHDDVTSARRTTPKQDPVFEIDNVTISYGGRPAIVGVNMEVAKNQVTAFIGPSGCGKTTLLRSLNRMNDLIPSASLDGTIRYHGYDLSAGSIDPVEVRRRIGMVFQRPNPFHKSIFDNVSFGIRLHNPRSDVKATVEQALRRAALWDEVKDRMDASALSLSGGQQQRLCIARAIAVDPDVILMDEPASALDPVATQKIEDLIAEIKDKYTIVIVTHNMQQASRVADMTAFFSVNDSAEGERHGILVEYDQTTSIFTNPSDPRTEAYVTGRFG
ncbi:MAG: phosphate ABC transporter ATP-binding protein PstB [Gaiellales bacterium]